VFVGPGRAPGDGTALSAPRMPSRTPPHAVPGRRLRRWRPRRPRLPR
jgi:hypothetical protein